MQDSKSPIPRAVAAALAMLIIMCVCMFSADSLTSENYRPLRRIRATRPWSGDAPPRPAGKVSNESVTVPPTPESTPPVPTSGIPEPAVTIPQDNSTDLPSNGTSVDQSPNASEVQSTPTPSPMTTDKASFKLPSRERKFLKALNTSIQSDTVDQLQLTDVTYLNDLAILARQKSASGDLFAKRTIQCLVTCNQDFRRVQEGTATEPKSKIAVLQVMSLPEEGLRHSQGELRKKRVDHSTFSRFGYFDSQLVNSQYAEKHGYDYISEDGSLDYKGRSPQWSKVLATIKWLPHYEWILYMDADAIVTNFDTTIESLIKKYTKGNDEVNFIVAAEADWLNTGTYLIRNTPKAMRFLSSEWHAPKESWNYNEQGPFNVLTGFQDSFAALSSMGEKHGAGSLQYPPEYQHSTFGWGTKFWKLAANKDLNSFPKGGPVKSWGGSSKHPLSKGNEPHWLPGHFILHTPAVATVCWPGMPKAPKKCAFLNRRAAEMHDSFPNRTLQNVESCCAFKKRILPFKNDVTVEQLIASLPPPDPMPMPKPSWKCGPGKDKRGRYGTVCTPYYKYTTVASSTLGLDGEAKELRRARDSISKFKP